MLDGPKASVHEQVLSIPGDPARPVAPEATLLMPDGPGPFPLAVMNHGANGKVRPALAPAIAPPSRPTISSRAAMR